MRKRARLVALYNYYLFPTNMSVGEDLFDKKAKIGKVLLCISEKSLRY